MENFLCVVNGLFVEIKRVGLTPCGGCLQTNLMFMFDLLYGLKYIQWCVHVFVDV